MNGRTARRLRKLAKRITAKAMWGTETHYYYTTWGARMRDPKTTRELYQLFKAEHKRRKKAGGLV